MEAEFPLLPVTVLMISKQHLQCTLWTMVGVRNLHSRDQQGSFFMDD